MPWRWCVGDVEGRSFHKVRAKKLPACFNIIVLWILPSQNVYVLPMMLAINSCFSPTQHSSTGMCSADSWKQFYKALTHWHTLVLSIVWFLNVSEAPAVVDPVFSRGATAPSGRGPPYYRNFTVTLRYTAFGRTSLDEWLTRRRDNIYHSQETGIHAPGGIRTRSPSKRVAVKPRGSAQWTPSIEFFPVTRHHSSVNVLWFLICAMVQILFLSPPVNF